MTHPSPVPQAVRRPLIRRLCRHAVLTSCLLGLPAAAGIVSFSENLLSHMARRFSAEAPHRLLDWQRLVNDLRAGGSKAERRRQGQAGSPALRRTNDFFNQVPYINDSAHWGQEDYWATPTEMLSSFGGDCEDYSIAKYLSLKELGIPIQRLRITYARVRNLNEPHMVLAYYPRPDAEPYILDNLVPEMKPASQRPDLEPVYSFNDDDLWLPTGASRKGGASHVRAWRNLKERLAREADM